MLFLVKVLSVIQSGTLVTLLCAGAERHGALVEQKRLPLEAGSGLAHPVVKGETVVDINVSRYVR